MATIANYRDLPQRDLTIYLLREDITDDEVFEHLRPIAAEHRIRLGAAIGRLFVVPRANDDGPEWAGLFENQVAANALGVIASIWAVFVIHVSGRLFALTFGGGRFLLRDNWVEEHFGFYAVLNLVHPDEIRSVDKRSLDAVGRQTRVQTSRAVAVREFGVDYERDLLRAVVGRPREEDLGTRVTGTAALRASVRINLANLPRLLAKYLDVSSGFGYRRRFPGIDSLRAVSDEQLIERLDQIVVQTLNDSDSETFSLAVPEIIDWQDVALFRFEGLNDPNDHYDLNTAELIGLSQDVGLEWTPNDLDRIHVRVLDVQGLPRGRWSLRKCLFGQITLDRKQMVLSSGTWYSVAPDLVAEVDQAFRRIPRLNNLPEFDDETEADYCMRFAQADPMWAVMDRRSISFGGGRSSVEFCDLFNRESRTMLHVKRYAGSAPLSHLFQQALVSGETFKTVAEFRALVNQKLPVAYRLQNPAQPPAGFRVALGIVKGGPQLDLPFFSKVTLRNAYRLLTGFGYSVALAHIQVGDDRARMAVARARRGDR